MEVKTDVFEVVRSVISEATQGKEVKLTTKLADLALGLGNKPDAYAIIGICLEIERVLDITLTKMERVNKGKILRETETVQGLANYYRELVAARFQDDPEEECVGFYGGGA